MAIVILGGLPTSTLLNMLVVPALHLRYGRISGASDAYNLARYAVYLYDRGFKETRRLSGQPPTEGYAPDVPSA